MGVHDHRFRLSRAARQAYDRVSEAAGDLKSDLSSGTAGPWPKAIIALGLAATLLWVLVLVGLALLGFLRMASWFSS
jgi:hypothetical protein